MQYDLTHQVVDDKGEAAVDENGKPADLKTILSRALLTDTADNTSTKLERFELWLKLKSAAVAVEFSTEEAKLIKDASKVYPTLIHGQLVHWIEQRI
jgi:hypothetical protein